MLKTVLMYGNPNEGFSYIGPFDTQDEAADFAEERGFIESAFRDGQDFVLYADIETPEAMMERLEM